MKKDSNSGVGVKVLKNFLMIIQWSQRSIKNLIKNLKSTLSKNLLRIWKKYLIK